MNELQNLIDAISILEKSERDTSQMPMPIYRYPMHAKRYLENQLTVLLRGE